MKAGRLALAVVAAGGFGTVAGGVALANGGHGAATATASSASATGVQAVDSGLVAQYNLAGGRHGRGGGFGGPGGFGESNGVALTNCGARAAGQVTGVNNNTITLAARRAMTETVTVSATTVYTQAQQAASLADVHTGSRILACGTGTATNLQASQVYIILPSVAGVVTNVNGSTLTLTGFGGATRTVTVSTATTYDRAGQSASLGDVTNGTAIVAQGNLGSDGTLSAVRVEIQVPRVAGQVTAVSGSTITLSSAYGGRGRGYGSATGNSPTTVVTSGQTTYSVISGTATTADAVKVGTYIIAQGTLSSDGKTLNALRIVVLPNRAGRFGGRGHGFGDADITPGAGTPSTGSGSTAGGFGVGQAPWGQGQFNGGFGHRAWGGPNGGAPSNGGTVSTANV